MEHLENLENLFQHVCDHKFRSFLYHIIVILCNALNIHTLLWQISLRLAMHKNISTMSLFWDKTLIQISHKVSHCTVTKAFVHATSIVFCSADSQGQQRSDGYQRTHANWSFPPPSTLSRKICLFVCLFVARTEKQCILSIPANHHPTF